MKLSRDILGDYWSGQFSIRKSTACSISWPLICKYSCLATREENCWISAPASEIMLLLLWLIISDFPW